MKLTLYITLVLATLLAGCTIEREVIIPAGSDFSTDIQRLVPLSTIQKVRELGITIYDGRNPPNVEGIYLLARNYMTKSSVPDESSDPNGFADYRIRIYRQDQKNLTASLDTKAVNQNTGAVISTATGQGTLLAGSGNYFSLFVVLESKRTNSTTRSRTLEVYSGEIAAGGIRNLQSTLFMLDDYGDPNDELIPVNTGRAFKDSNGFSERLGSFRVAAPENTSDLSSKITDRTGSAVNSKN